MWAIQDYALSVLSQATNLDCKLHFNMVWGLCSAAAFHYEANLTLQHPHSCMRELTSNHPCLPPGCPASDHLLLSHVMSGLAC
eukprot:12973551-Ditylum_brightwellii.AAC.1